jgi:hypothetical protein
MNTSKQQTISMPALIVLPLQKKFVFFITRSFRFAANAAFTQLTGEFNTHSRTLAVAPSTSAMTDRFRRPPIHVSE